MLLRSFAALLCACAFSGAHAAGDPLASETWADIVELEFDGAPVVHDDSFYLVLPERVEEAFSVPVTIGFADTPYEIAEIAVFAENNPFPEVARVTPHRPLGGIGLNIRLEQSTPVRAAARDASASGTSSTASSRWPAPAAAPLRGAASAEPSVKSPCASSSAPRATAGSS